MLKPHLERLNQAVNRLETALETYQPANTDVNVNQGEFDLALQKERENTRMVAAKLDSTIERLEALLAQE